MRAPSTVDKPFEYVVIGQHRLDLDCLLLMGSDGNYYAFSLDDGESRLIELTDQWLLDAPYVRDKPRYVSAA